VVAADNAAGIGALAGHLIETHGNRDLCFVAGPADSPDARERLTSFRRAVAGRAGCRVDRVLAGDFSEASGAAAARELLAERPLPDAIACANDQMAIGVLGELRRAGVRVPQDVAVTGFDDIYASRILSPGLTTVSQPLRELGRRAARRLRARIDDRRLAPQAEILPTRLIIRASCGCPLSHAGPTHTGSTSAGPTSAGPTHAGSTHAGPSLTDTASGASMAGPSGPGPGSIVH
jgi:DNA-binding LacI/PurR family transcriptional regulator